MDDESESSIEIGAIQKLRYAVEVKRVNDELLEHLSSSLRWVLHYCDKNNLPLPNRDEINKIVDRAIEIEKSANRGVTRRKTTDKVKDPYSIRFIRYPYRTIR